MWNKEPGRSHLSALIFSFCVCQPAPTFYRSYPKICVLIEDLRKLNELGVKEKYQIEIRNRFAALENLNGDEKVNRAWENIKENIKTAAKESLGLHEWKQHKPWFDKECVDFLDQRKQAKMQWI